MQGKTARLIFLALSFFIFNPAMLAAADQSLFSSPAGAPSGKVRVQRVISADTLLLENNERVHLIGLKALPTPEIATVERDQHGFVIEKTTPMDSLEEQAFNFVKELLEGKYVYLEFDTQKKDEDFHIQAYVFTEKDKTFVNAEVLRKGYASLHILPPNMKYAERLRAAYLSARQEKSGLHGD